MRARPDTRLIALAFGAGVLAVHAGADLPSLGLLILLCIPALIPWRGRLLWSAAQLGVLLVVLQASHRLEHRWPAERHAQEVEVIGHVSSLVERTAGFSAKQGRNFRFEFAPHQSEDLPDHLRISWYEADLHPRAGECWKFRLKMRTPHGSLNPGAFDYEAWLYRRGVGGVASVRSGERCDISRSFPVLNARQWIKQHLDDALGDHPGKAMIAALTIGDDSGFSKEDWDHFRQTGTSHLVAISGFNVAILAGLAFLIVRWSWPAMGNLALRFPAQKAGMVAAAIAGLAYGLLAGWDSPAQRAAIMLALLLMAALPDRQPQLSSALAAALILMLCMDPSSVLSPGLWLSFGAVAAIFYATTHRLEAPSAWRSGIRIQIMLSILLAPLTLYFFQGAAWLGMPVNLIAVPVMTVLTPLVVGASALAAIVPEPGIALLGWVADVMQALQSGLAWIAAHAPLAWFPASPPRSALLLALFGALLLFAPRGVPLRGLGFLCFLPLMFSPRASVQAPFDLNVLDVGQGLAVLVRTQNHVLLYDAGPAFPGGFDAGEAVVVPFVLSQGERGLDRLLLSHGDRDHAGGVNAVREWLPVTQEIGTDAHTPCADGQGWTWDGVQFEILHPDEQSWSDNNRSCVLRIQAEGFSALLAGDIERGAEARLLGDHADRLKADVLIAPHHGSKTSSTLAFVQAVAPQVVVFGAGWRSHFGHPRPEVVARYEAIGARSLVTGVEGAVRVWRDPQGEVRTSSWRREHSRFWSAPAEP